MPISRSQKAILHVAKAHLKLTDAHYRSALVQIAGVTTSTELDQEGFDAVMGFFGYCGFKPLEKTGHDYGERPGMASFAQIELIRALWREWSGQRVAGKDVDATGLNTWLKRTFKVDSLRFLSSADGQKAIAVLKAMKAHKARAA
ncbi:MAG: regulatory protein GemA [Rhodobacterales bacterium]|nr:regulatory protein GemA [Rhodobacterales bacterium]